MFKHAILFSEIKVPKNKFIDIYLRFNELFLSVNTASELN